MYVCICHDVNDKAIKKAISEGYDTLGELQQHLKVATCCGCCQPMVQDLLDEHQQKLAMLAIPA